MGGDGDGDGDEDENERRIERINLHRHLGVRDNRGTYRHSRRLFLIKSSHTFVMMMRKMMIDDESWPLAQGPLTFLEYFEVAERGWWMRFERFVTPRCYNNDTQ